MEKSRGMRQKAAISSADKFHSHNQVAVGGLHVRSLANNFTFASEMINFQKDCS
jgi:hypothetical protein